MATSKNTARKAPGKKPAARKAAPRKTTAREAPPRKQATRKRPGRSTSAGAKPERPDEHERQGQVRGAGAKTAAASEAEETVHGRFYQPVTDIYETGDALLVVTELPGVATEGLVVHYENEVLTVQGRVDVGNYAGLTPVYTEYDVGHFTRRFRLPGSVDPDDIRATHRDGVLVLELKKSAGHRRRRIPVG